MKNYIVKFLAVLVFIYIGLMSFLYFNQEKFLYHPTNIDILDPEEYGLEDTEEVYLYTPDMVKIHVWYHRGEGDKTFVFFHGNAGNITDRVDYLKSIQSLNGNFVILSWRGYGKSQGKPSIKGFNIDAKTVMRFLYEKGHDISDTVLVGESLGTGIATKLATEQRFAGLLLISPYTSISDLAKETFFYIPIRLILKHNFDNISYIDKVKSPILIAHGNKDRTVSHKHSEKLIRPANYPKKLILYDDKDHNELPSHELIMDAFRFFFE